MRDDALGEAAQDRHAGGRRLDHRSGGGIAQHFGDDAIGHLLAGNRQEQRVLAGNQPLEPAARTFDELPDRQRVEEFVGDNDQRAIGGQCVDRVVPGRVRQALGLRRAQHRAGLHQMHRRRETGLARRAQRVGRKRSATGAEFDPRRVRPPGAVPQIGTPQPDQLAEHLADLGRGGEIAAAAERIARRIILLVGRRHELRERNRPGERDRTGEAVG
ncbi:hypothetical protein D9M73_189970 [compost metagenome]